MGGFLLLVPGQDVSIILGIVVALPMEHNALTRRKQSVAVFKVSEHRVGGLAMNDTLECTDKDWRSVWVLTSL